MQVYDRAYCIKMTILWSLFIAVGVFTKSIDYLLAFPLICYAVINKRPNFLAFLLLLMTMVQCTNYVISPKTVLYLYVQRGGMLLFGAVFALKLMTSRKNSIFSVLLLFIVYVLYMILPSVIGWAPIVSMLKILLFICAFSLFVGISKTIVESPNVDCLKLRSIIVAYSVVMFGYSMVLLLFPAVGYMGMADMISMGMTMQVGQGLSFFQGMTQHSQCLGPVSALSIVLIAGDYILGVKKNFLPYNIALVCASICLWKSASRTAMVSAMFGVVLLLFTFANSRVMGSRWKRAVLSFSFQLILACLIAIALVPKVRGSVLRFVSKYNDANSSAEQLTIDDITSSRRGALENPLHNWRQSPLIGNGFQVSAGMTRLKDAPIAEMLTAPVEKGTWIVAVLEEGGVMGMALFLVWVWVSCLRFWHKKEYISFAATMTFLTINLGEFTMFSLTSVGCLLWALTLFSMIMDSVRLREERRYREMLSWGFP